MLYHHHVRAARDIAIQLSSSGQDSTLPAPIRVAPKFKRGKRPLNVFQDDRGFPDQSDEFDQLLSDIDGGPILRKRRHITPSLDDIKRTCMDLYRISKSDIESASKVRTICHPRQVAMYLSRVMTDKSFPQIATAYKKKDHTTVLHAYRKIKKALDKGDRDMSEEIERVKNAVFDRLAGHDQA